MQITYNLPHVFHSSSSSVENAIALRILLDSLIAFNTAYLTYHSAPELYRSGVVYGRTTWWEPLPALYKRKYGDCKSLSALRVVERRRAGFRAEPVFRFVDNDYGGTDYHILLQTDATDFYVNNEGFEDPSKVLGMGANENARFYDPNKFYLR